MPGLWKNLKQKSELKNIQNPLSNHWKARKIA
jgi:hypothetical protein